VDDQYHSLSILGQQLGLNSLYPQTPNPYALQSFCPCYNFAKFNHFTAVEHSKELGEEEEEVEAFNENYKANSNDSSQRHTCDCKLSFNAQHQHDTEATKMQHDIDNCAFESTATYKVEMLNEKLKKSQFTDNFVVDKECAEVEKGK
jgi:hypothetical protein